MTKACAPAARWRRSPPATLEWTEGRRTPQGRRAPREKKARRQGRGKAADDDSGQAVPLPKFVEPQLATLVEAPPAGDDWLHEIKYDGYRAVAAVGGGQRPNIYTRTGLDWTDKFAPLVRPLADLPCRSALARRRDRGRRRGRPDRFRRAAERARRRAGQGIAYYVFDLLELDGDDLRKLPLIERKAKLAELLRTSRANGPLILFRPCRRPRRATCFEQRLRDEARRHRLASAPTRLSSRAAQELAQDQVRHGPGIHHRRLAAVGLKARPFSSLLVGVREGDQSSIAAGSAAASASASCDALARTEEARGEDSRRPRMCPPTSAATRISSSRSWSPRSSSAAGPTTATSARRFKGLRNDKKPARRRRRRRPKRHRRPSSAARPRRSRRHGRRHHRYGPATTARSRSRACASPIPTGSSIPETRITKRRLIEYYLGGRRPDAAACRGPAAQPGALSGRRRRRLLLPETRLARAFPTSSSRSASRRRPASDDYLYIEDERGPDRARCRWGRSNCTSGARHVKTLETARPHGLRLRSRRGARLRRGQGGGAGDARPAGGSSA